MALTNTGPAAHERVDQLRVLYAGDIELARPQFASGARQLSLVPLSEVVGTFGGRGVAAGLDVAVIDCGAPGLNAPQVVSQLRTLRLPIPLVLVIDPSVENGASMALSLQSDDYTVKTPGWLSRLPVRLEIVVSRYRRLKQLETAGQLEQRLKAAVERAPVCLARVLDDGTVAAMNDAACSMLAVDSLQDVLKKPLATFVASGHQQALTEFLSTVCGGEARSVELAIVPKHGDERIMEARGVALPQEANGRPSAIIVLRDVSERRRLEASVLDVATVDVAAERAANERLAAEIGELRQRLADAESQQQQLAHDRDAQRLAAEAATSETARVHALLVEREQSSANVGNLERAYHEARAQAEQAARAVEHERQQAAALLRDAANELQEERQRCSAIEQRLDAEEIRLFAAVAARDTESMRVNELAKECEALRATAEQLTRAAGADRDTHLGRIQDLERSLHESGGASAALDQERRAREAAELRLSELQRLSSDDQAAHAEANEAHAAAVAVARATAAQAIEQRDALRQELDAERHRHQLAAAAPAVLAPPNQEAVLREQMTAIEALTTRLRDAEAASQRASAERDTHEKAVRALEAELHQFVDLRRGHRQELLAALNDAQTFEDLAARHLAKCAELERRLRAAKVEFDELTGWAAARAARVAEGLA